MESLGHKKREKFIMGIRVHLPNHSAMAMDYLMSHTAEKSGGVYGFNEEICV